MTRILPSDVTFSQATTTEQLTAVWTLNASEWAPPLSVSNHIERERTLSQQPATGKHWRTWLLTLKEHPDEIVSSVETFERPIVVKSGEAGVKKEKAYAIASVFTNPKYRKNGMASLMMEKLKEWLDEDGEGYLSVLYSDIGRVSVIVLYQILCMLMRGNTGFLHQTRLDCSLHKYLGAGNKPKASPLII